MNEPRQKSLLKVAHLSVFSRDSGKPVKIVDDLSFTIYKNEIVSLIGQSGCGKTVTAKALLGLLPPGLIQTTGKMYFNGQKMNAADNKSFESLRGRNIAMVFQDPHTALNPVFKVGTQLSDVVKIHFSISGEAARRRCYAILNDVEIADAGAVYNSYTHQLSGGLAQRVMLAMALLCRPRLLIADEPTSALDVTTQAAILRLLKKLKNEHHFSILMITHDLQLVRYFTDRIIIMEGGKIIESGSYDRVFLQSQHPVTQLLKSNLL